MLAPGVRGAIVDRMSQQVLADPVQLLRQIEAPTLLMWGERDGMIPSANSADYLRALPRATLAVLPGIGHLPQEEAPGYPWGLAIILGPVARCHVWSGGA
jgi:pimeloyl-ACP methyl ester carboxylesterase